MVSTDMNENEGSFRLPREFDNITFANHGSETLEEVIRNQNGKIVLLSYGNKPEDDGIYDLVRLGPGYSATLMDGTRIEFKLDSLGGMLIPRDDLTIKTPYSGRFKKFIFPSGHLTPRKVLSSVINETAIVNNLPDDSVYNSGVLKGLDSEDYLFETTDQSGNVHIQSHKMDHIAGIFIPFDRVLPEFLTKFY